jgi:hypothetical protein
MKGKGTGVSHLQGIFPALALKNVPIFPALPVFLEKHRQAWKSLAQVPQGIAGEAALTGKLAPWPKRRQRHHFTSAQGGGWARMNSFLWQLHLATIVHDHVQCQEGLNVHQQLAPFLRKFGSAHCKTLGLFLSTPFYFTPNVLLIDSVVL